MDWAFLGKQYIQIHRYHIYVYIYIYIKMQITYKRGSIACEALFDKGKAQKFQPQQFTRHQISVHWETCSKTYKKCLTSKILGSLNELKSQYQPLIEVFISVCVCVVLLQSIVRENKVGASVIQLLFKQSDAFTVDKTVGTIVLICL